MTKNKKESLGLSPETLALASVLAAVLHKLEQNGIWSSNTSIPFLEELAMSNFMEDKFKSGLALHYIIRELEMLEKAKLAYKTSRNVTEH